MVNEYREFVLFINLEDPNNIPNLVDDLKKEGIITDVGFAYSEDSFTDIQEINVDEDIWFPAWYETKHDAIGVFATFPERAPMDSSEIKDLSEDLNNLSQLGDAIEENTDYDVDYLERPAG